MREYANITTFRWSTRKAETYTMSFTAAYYIARFIGHRVQGLFCHLSHQLEPSLFPDQPCNNSNQTTATTTQHYKKLLHIFRKVTTFF